MGEAAYLPTREPQKITIAVDLQIGQYCASPAERIRLAVVDELLKMGTEINSVRVDIKGQMASW